MIGLKLFPKYVRQISLILILTFQIQKLTDILRPLY